MDGKIFRGVDFEGGLLKICNLESFGNANCLFSKCTYNNPSCALMNHCYRIL